MPNVNNYTEKLQKLKNTAIEYLKGNPSDIQVDLFLDELKSMREADELGFFTENEKKSYEDLIETLKAPQNETPIHKYIKNSARTAFALMAGDMKSKYISNVCYYSELYNFLSNGEKLREEHTEYVQKMWAEDQCNDEIRNAFKANDQDAMDLAIIDREKNGFSLIRKQFKQVGYEESGIFKSCLGVLKYSEEIVKKENKTEIEKKIEQLRNSNLFIPYIKVASEINKDREKILYNDDRIKEAMNREDQVKQAKQTKQAEQAARLEAENRKKTADFAKHRDEHADGIIEQFKQFETVEKRIRNELNSGKKTEVFKEMYKQMLTFGAYTMDGESYKRGCLAGENLDRYNKQIEELNKKVDAYIKHKQRQFFPGKLGKARLNAAKEMKALLTSMQSSIKNFKKYSNDHPQERDRLIKEDKEAANAVTNAIAGPYKLFKEEKRPEVENTVTNAVAEPYKLFKEEKQPEKEPEIAQVKRSRRNSISFKNPRIKSADFINAEKKKLSDLMNRSEEEKLAQFKMFLSVIKDETVLKDVKKIMLRDVGIKENKIKEKISFAELQRDVSLTKKEAGKNKRSKTMEDIKSNRKLKLENPMLKK